MRGRVSIAVLCLGWQSLGVAQRTVVRIRGAASTVYVGQRVAMLYQSESPGAATDVNVSDSVQTLPVGRNSVWQHLRPSSSAEKRLLQEKFGVRPTEIPIGIEGVLVIVNNHNPITELSIAQLRSIYTGQIANWKELGGPDRRIQLYSTEAVVGGSMFFQDLVLQHGDIDTTMRGYSNPKDTAKAVASDVAGIGLVPDPAETNVKYPLLRRDDGPAVSGTSDNVRNLSYPLSSYVYWSFPDSPEVEHFVAFALSSHGQLAVEASGCYPLNADMRLRGQLAIAKAK